VVSIIYDGAPVISWRGNCNYMGFLFLTNNH